MLTPQVLERPSIMYNVCVGADSLLHCTVIMTRVIIIIARPTITAELPR